jgi:hypothetical protein
MKKKKRYDYDDQFIDICFCGHTGARKKSEHEYDYFLPGSGRCLVNGCGCAKFVWKRSVEMKIPLAELKERLEERNEKGKEEEREGNEEVFKG